MTRISSLTPASPFVQAQASQALSTNMSFEDALRSADTATNRAFAFNELGMFGHAAVTKSAGSRVDASRSPAPAPPPSAAEAQALAGPPSSRADARVSGERAASAADPQADRRPAGNAGSLPADEGPGPAASTERLAGGHASAPGEGAADDRFAPPLASSAHVRAAPRGSAPSPVRVAVMVEDGRVHIVARDFTLSEEDRARLEDQADELVRSRGLVRAELTLNGVREAAVGPTGQGEG